MFMGGATRPRLLIEDALENVVSAFDAFGRELCAQKAADIRFQNISVARRRVRETFGFDFADGLDSDAWAAVCRIFQKRHLLAHKMGRHRQRVPRKSQRSCGGCRRRIQVMRDEVSLALSLTQSLGEGLFNGMLATK